MSSTIWRFWEDNRTEKEVKTESQYKRYNKPAVSEKVQQLVSDFYGYFRKSIPRKNGTTKETIKALKLSKRAI